MFNGNKVIDTDGHVMEPNDLYDRYLETKLKPDLEDLKKEADGRASRYFFGIFHQLNTGRPLGVPIRPALWCGPGANPRDDKPDMRGGSGSSHPNQGHGSRRASISQCPSPRWFPASARSRPSNSKNRDDPRALPSMAGRLLLGVSRAAQRALPCFRCAIRGRAGGGDSASRARSHGRSGRPTCPGTRGSLARSSGGSYDLQACQDTDLARVLPRWHRASALRAGHFRT